MYVMTPLNTVDSDSLEVEVWQYAITLFMQDIPMLLRSYNFHMLSFQHTAFAYRLK